MLIEIVCGPIAGSEVLKEIPFVCSLFLDGGGAHISIMYGVGCNADNDRLWSPCDIETAKLPAWIERSIQDAIFVPGESDIFIFDRERLTAHLCHEADINIQTASASIRANLRGSVAETVVSHLA